MSANNTNPDDKKPRHRASLFGISGSVIFAAVLFVALLFYLLTRDDGPTRIAPVGSVAPQSE